MEPERRILENDICNPDPEVMEEESTEEDEILVSRLQKQLREKEVTDASKIARTEKGSTFYT